MGNQFIVKKLILGENCIVFVPGANLLLTEEEVLQAENLIKHSKIVLFQGEVSEPANMKALLLAKKHNG